MNSARRSSGSQKLAIKISTVIAALTCLTSEVQAQAAVTDSYSGDTTGEPGWNRPVGTGGLSFTGTNVPYEAIQIRITDAAAFFATIASASYDTYLHLYLGDFDPSAQHTNLVAGDDDGGAGLFSSITTAADGPFTEDQYTVVVSGFSNSSFGTYLLELGGALLGWGPSVEEQIEELKAVLEQGGRQTLLALAANVNRATGQSFVSRNASGFTKDGRSVVSWVKMAGIKSEHDSRSFQGTLTQVGADVALQPNLIAGAAVGFGGLAVNGTDLNYDGKQVLFQPYIGWSQNAWNGSASLVLGKIDYGTITTLSGAAAAEGQLLGINAEVARDMVLEDGTVVSLFTGVHAGRVKLNATSGTLAGAGLSDSVRFNETSLGVRVSKNFTDGLLSVGFSADQSSSNASNMLYSGSYDTSGWSGSTEISYRHHINDKAMLDAYVAAGGLGRDNRKSYTGSLQVTVNF